MHVCGWVGLDVGILCGLAGDLGQAKVTLRDLRDGELTPPVQMSFTSAPRGSVLPASSGAVLQVPMPVPSAAPEPKGVRFSRMPVFNPLGRGRARVLPAWMSQQQKMGTMFQQETEPRADEYFHSGSTSPEEPAFKLPVAATSCAIEHLSKQHESNGISVYQGSARLGAWPLADVSVSAYHGREEQQNSAVSAMDVLEAKVRVAQSRFYHLLHSLDDSKSRGVRNLRVFMLQDAPTIAYAEAIRELLFSQFYRENHSSSFMVLDPVTRSLVPSMWKPNEIHRINVMMALHEVFYFEHKLQLGDARDDKQNRAFEYREEWSRKVVPGEPCWAAKFLKICADGVRNNMLHKFEKLVHLWSTKQVFGAIVCAELEDIISAIRAGREQKKAEKKRRKREFLEKTPFDDGPPTEDHFFDSVTPPPTIAPDDIDLSEDCIDKPRKRPRCGISSEHNMYTHKLDEERKGRSLGLSYASYADFSRPMVVDAELRRLECAKSMLHVIRSFTRTDEKSVGKMIGNWMFDLVRIRDEDQVASLGKTMPMVDPVFGTQNPEMQWKSFNHRYRTLVGLKDFQESECRSAYNEVLKCIESASNDISSTIVDGSRCSIVVSSLTRLGVQFVKLRCPERNISKTLTKEKYDSMCAEFHECLRISKSKVVPPVRTTWEGEKEFGDDKEPCSSSSLAKDEKTSKEDTLLTADSAIFCILVRYETLFQSNAGSQGSVPPRVFQVLKDYLNVDGECYASPLNHYLPLYFSAFPDIDCPFLSLGSFFNDAANTIEEGSWECNPPFDVESIICAMQRIASYLHSAEQKGKSLTFSVVFSSVNNNVPLNDVILYLEQYKRGSRLIHKHTYLYGFRHRSEDHGEHWEPNRPTQFFLFQTSAGYHEHCLGSPERVEFIIDQVAFAFEEGLPERRKPAVSMY